MTKTRVPYACNSWRCPGCARHEAAVTFARIKQATTPLDPRGFVFGVLTLDRAGYYSGQPWKNAQEAYRALGRQSELFLKRLRRWMKARGMQPIGSKWVAVVEAHRSGWPHINLVLHAPELAEFLERDAERIEGSTREKALVRGEMRAIATASGWGVQSTLERARSIDALNGYVTKLAGLADAASGEIAKITQAPTMAPQRFRRLRSGKGFLPKRHKNPEWTGTLIRRQQSIEDGTPEAIPLHKVAPAMVPHVAACSYIEQAELLKELEETAKKSQVRKFFAGHGLKSPAVRVYVHTNAQDTYPTPTQVVSPRFDGQQARARRYSQQRPRPGPDG